MVSHQEPKDEAGKDEENAEVAEGHPQGGVEQDVNGGRRAAAATGDHNLGTRAPVGGGVGETRSRHICVCQAVWVDTCRHQQARQTRHSQEGGGKRPGGVKRMLTAGEEQPVGNGVNLASVQHLENLREDEEKRRELHDGESENTEGKEKVAVFFAPRGLCLRFLTSS